MSAKPIAYFCHTCGEELLRTDKNRYRCPSCCQYYYKSRHHKKDKETPDPVEQNQGEKKNETGEGEAKA